MREVHALCEAHFMHLVGPMDDSDALRYMCWAGIVAHPSRHPFPDNSVVMYSGGRGHGARARQTGGVLDCVLRVSARAA